MRWERTGREKKRRKRWPRTEKETRSQLLLLNFQFETYNSLESTLSFGTRTTEVSLQRTKGGGGIELRVREKLYDF